MLGVTLDEYEDMTPRQLDIKRQAHIEVKKQEAEEYRIKLQNEKSLLVQQAIWISRWVWAKRISQSDIERALGIEKKPTGDVMTDEEIYKELLKLCRMSDGEVRTDGTAEK